MKENGISVLFERISVFGAAFVVHEQSELFTSYLRSLQQLCNLAYKRSTSADQDTFDISEILNEVLKWLYFLGALAILEEKWNVLSSLMQSSIHLVPLDIEPRHWFQHLQRKRAESLTNSNLLLIDIIDSIKSVGYVNQQFSNYGEVLTEYLCRCDFIHCLYFALVVGDPWTSARPFFGVFDLKHITPMMKQLINKSQFRDVIFGVNISNKELALAIARFGKVIRTSNPPMRDFWHQSLWDGGTPTLVWKFLREYLSENPGLYYDILQ